MIIYNILLVLLSVVGIGFIALGIFQEKVLGESIVQYAKIRGILSILTVISILMTTNVIKTDIFLIDLGIENIAIVACSIITTVLYFLSTYSRNCYYSVDFFYSIIAIFFIPLFFKLPDAFEFLLSKLL